MHPLNRVLSLFDLSLARAQKTKKIPKAFLKQYHRNLKALRKDSHGFLITKEVYFEAGAHPESYVDYECQFAVGHLAALRPRNILDIGSYRHFILGLLASFQVTTIDVRDRNSPLENETVIAADAKNVPMPDDSYDAVLSLCALEHFGLGRYGDDFDPDADVKGIAEMRRVLKPGGHLVLSTTITGGPATIAFNAHRIYTIEMIRDFWDNLHCVDERLYSFRLGRLCSLDELTREPGALDIYMGCWRKDGRPPRG